MNGNRSQSSCNMPTKHILSPIFWYQTPIRASGCRMLHGTAQWVIRQSKCASNYWRCWQWRVKPLWLTFKKTLSNCFKMDIWTSCCKDLFCSLVGSLRIFKLLLFSIPNIVKYPLPYMFACDGLWWECVHRWRHWGHIARPWPDRPCACCQGLCIHCLLTWNTYLLTSRWTKD